MDIKGLTGRLENAPASVRWFFLWLAFTAAIFAYKYWTLDVPASWDASWTTLAGAVTLADNGFSIRQLTELPPWHQGGPRPTPCRQLRGTTLLSSCWVDGLAIHSLRSMSAISW